MPTLSSSTRTATPRLLASIRACANSCSGNVIAEDIGTHGEAMFGGPDRRQHLGIGFITAFKDLEGIARCQRGLGHVPADQRKGS